MEANRGGARDERAVVPGHTVDDRERQTRARRVIQVERAGAARGTVEVVLAARRAEAEPEMRTREGGMERVVVFVLELVVASDADGQQQDLEEEDEPDEPDGRARTTL